MQKQAQVFRTGTACAFITDGNYKLPYAGITQNQVKGQRFKGSLSQPAYPAPLA